MQNVALEVLRCTNILAGYYPGFQPASLPAIPGLEGYGKIEKVSTICSISTVVLFSTFRRTKVEELVVLQRYCFQ